MAKIETQLEFSATTRTSDLWKSISSAITTIIDEAHFEANPEGLQFRSMDPSHVALIDISCPAVAFEKYQCSSPVKFGFRVNDFSKVIKRAGSNDSIQLTIQDSMLTVKTSGSYSRTYKLKLIESNSNISGSSTPLPELTFENKLVMAPGTLDKILSDIEVVESAVTIETTQDKQAIFRTRSDLGEAKITIDDKSGVDNLKEISVSQPSKASFSTVFITKVVKAVSPSSEEIVTEYAANKPLKMTFALPNAVKVEFFMAPRAAD